MAVAYTDAVLATPFVSISSYNANALCGSPALTHPLISEEYVIASGNNPFRRDSATMSKARSSASVLNSSKAAARPHAETKQFNTLTSICNPLACKSERKLNTRSNASFTYEISFLLFDLKPPLPERLPTSRDNASINAPYVTIVGSILSFFVIVLN